MNKQACPFCKNDNDCKVNERSSCWCSRADVSPQLIDLLPEYLKGRACICLVCVNAFNGDAVAFKLKYKNINNSSEK